MLYTLNIYKENLVVHLYYGLLSNEVNRLLILAVDEFLENYTE